MSRFIQSFGRPSSLFRRTAHSHGAIADRVPASVIQRTEVCNTSNRLFRTRHLRLMLVAAVLSIVPFLPSSSLLVTVGFTVAERYVSVFVKVSNHSDMFCNFRGPAYLRADCLTN